MKYMEGFLHLGVLGSLGRVKKESLLGSLLQGCRTIMGPKKGPELRELHIYLRNPPPPLQRFGHPYETLYNDCKALMYKLSLGSGF